MSSLRRAQVRPVVAVVACALLVLTACGKRNTGDTTPTVTTPAPTTVPLTGAATSTSVADTVATTATTTVAPTTLEPAVTKAVITANWEKFFLPTTSIDDRVALLENGESLRQALVQRAADPLMQQASAKVKSIDLTNSGTATVTYDVFLNGTVALSDSQGTAVLQDGVWKVGAESFCALIILGATGPIPGCS